MRGGGCAFDGGDFAHMVTKMKLEEALPLVEELKEVLDEQL